MPEGFTSRNANPRKAIRSHRYVLTIQCPYMKTDQQNMPRIETGMM